MPRDSGFGSFTIRRALGSVELSKKVIVSASGETERHALPFLPSHLQSRSLFVEDVLILRCFVREVRQSCFVRSCSSANYTQISRKPRLMAALSEETLPRVTRPI